MVIKRNVHREWETITIYQPLLGSAFQTIFPGRDAHWIEFGVWGKRGGRRWGFGYVPRSNVRSTHPCNRSVTAGLEVRLRDTSGCHIACRSKKKKRDREGGREGETTALKKRPIQGSMLV